MPVFALPPTFLSETKIISITAYSHSVSFDVEWD